MTETITGKTVDAEIENPEQASTNFYWTYSTTAGVFNLQTTIRGILTTEQIKAHIKSELEAVAHIVSLGGVAKQVGKSAYDTPAEQLPKPTEVEKVIATVQQSDPLWNQPESEKAKGEAPKESGGTTFMTTFLEVTNIDGKLNFKVLGEPPYHKYGVRVWDNVLTAMEINIASLEGGKKYDFKGYRATVTLNEKGFKKVSKLEKVA